jgi:hypothetical protein
MSVEEILKNLDNANNLSDSSLNWILMEALEYIWRTHDVPIETILEFASKLGRMNNGNPLLIFTILTRLIKNRDHNLFCKEVEGFSDRAFELLSASSDNIQDLFECLASFVTVFCEARAKEFLETHWNSPKWELRRAAICIAVHWPNDYVREFHSL